ncbi:ATP-binding cassette domain-containing protein [Aliiglaciecola sp.]|nr:ATP-binding cassette domain-containing protein [Aliiglaciecola sp.]
MTNKNSDSPISSVALSVSKLAYSYSSTSRSLTCEDWSLQRGDKVFLYGDSGSGKSTLLSLLCGIARPQKGLIKIGDTDLSELSATQLDQLRANRIGVVFQQFNLIPYLSVLQNIELATYFAHSTVDVNAKIHAMLPQLNLHSDILESKVAALSVGQKQRVAIMRALVNEPEILLIDEPTSALDANARDGFMRMLLAISQSTGSTMVFVSHDGELRQYFDKHIAIKDICSWSDNQEVSC